MDMKPEQPHSRSRRYWRLVDAIDAALAATSELDPTPERSQVTTKLTEALLWTGLVSERPAAEREVEVEAEPK